MSIWRSDRPRRRLAAGLAALIACGCGEELGPRAMPTARVVGRIRYGGQPIESGWVEFHPVGGTVGKIRSARIGPNGRFEADRVAVGTNILLFINPPSEEDSNGIRNHGILGEFTAKPIVRRAVEPVGPTELDIDLRDEYATFRRDHPAG